MSWVDPSGNIRCIREQNYRNHPVSQELLVSRLEGRTVDFLKMRM
jgi:hypothetical protein